MQGKGSKKFFNSRIRKKKRHAVTNGKKISIVYDFKLKAGLIFARGGGEEEERGEREKQNEKKKEEFPEVIFAAAPRLATSLLYDRRRSPSS